MICKRGEELIWFLSNDAGTCVRTGAQDELVRDTLSYRSHIYTSIAIGSMHPQSKECAYVACILWSPCGRVSQSLLEVYFPLMMFRLYISSCIELSVTNIDSATLVSIMVFERHIRR